MNCKICGRKAHSEYCVWHKPRKKLKSNPSGKKESFPLLRELYLNVWGKRLHRSEISGEAIHGEPLTIYFHHILPKNKYKEAKYDEENIVILTFPEHQKVESDPTFYEEINRRRELLLEKYETWQENSNLEEM